MKGIGIKSQFKHSHAITRNHKLQITEDEVVFLILQAFLDGIPFLQIKMEVTLENHVFVAVSVVALLIWRTN